jgi:plastocyanin
VKPQVRDRILLPIVLPIGILLLIAGILYGFSRVLLNIEGAGATTVALVVAGGIVISATVAASRTRVGGTTVAAMAGAVAGVAMLSGGVALAVLAGGESEAGSGGPSAVVQLTAQNLAFQPTALTVPAGEPFTIAFSNQDAGVQHNVQIFDNPDRSGTPIFDGDLVTGVAKASYQVQALDAGTYFFHCVVHPTMIGTIEATPGGGSQGGGPGGGGVTVTAQNLAFDTSTIDLPSNAPSTITFDNKDAGVQHNIAIYRDDTLADVLFKGDLVTGPATATYDVPALPAGTYYFHCDVHPTMNGSVAVGGSGGGGPGGGGSASGATGPTVATGASGASGVTGSVGASGSSGTSGAGGGGGTAQPSTIVAQNLAFDTSAITLPAGVSSTITFDNEDAGVQHDIAIYTDDSLSTNLFRGDLVTGPATKEYTIPALDAGTYYFHCDVHPTMNGTVTVS